MIKKSMRDSYTNYLKSTKNPIDKKTYLIINSKFNKFLIEKVLNGEKVTLPSRMGTLCIVGRKQKVRFDEEGNVIGLAPDWVKTRELWDSNPKAKEERKRIFHTNNHTNNIRYKFLWSKSQVLAKNKTLYALRLTRANKRAVHKKIMEGIEYMIKF